MEQRHKKNLRCTRVQIQLLQKYMANNKTIAYPTNTKRYTGTLEANKRAKEWCALRALLRKHGPDKSVEKWKQTWRDLKKKLKKQKLEAAAKGIKVESLSKKEIEKKCCHTIINNSDTIHETSMEYVDPLESIGEGGASIKEEPCMSPVEEELPSIDINLDIPCSSPMQVVLTNTEAFMSTSTSSTQNACKPNSGCTHCSNPPCISRKPPSICSCTSNRPSICSCSSKPPSICVHENSSTRATHTYAQCSRQNIPMDALPGTNNLLNQQNALLQRLCNLLEEQNSNLRIRNRIERNKMRFQFCRRF